MIARTPGSGRPSSITADMKALVEQQMRCNDETTATQLYTLVVHEGYSIDNIDNVTGIGNGSCVPNYARIFMRGPSPLEYLVQILIYSSASWQHFCAGGVDWQ